VAAAMLPYVVGVRETNGSVFVALLGFALQRKTE
jgi:hypothetical protein